MSGKIRPEREIEDVIPQPPQRGDMHARASSPTDVVAKESFQAKAKFEAGLAGAEVILQQDLQEHGPSLEIAQKYVLNATSSLAKCILIPNCAEPRDAIQRVYDFADWFACEAMKAAWVWLSVFSEMSISGKTQQHHRDGSTMSEAELREWRGCLSAVAYEAMDKFVSGFWGERYKYFSSLADGSAPAESADSKAADENKEVRVPVENSADLPLNAVARNHDIDERPAKKREGDITLLGDKRLVSFRTAEQYLGLTDRQRLNLINNGQLKVEGKGQKRKITTESLKAYRPPDISN